MRKTWAVLFGMGLVVLLACDSAQAVWDTSGQVEKEWNESNTVKSFGQVVHVVASYQCNNWDNMYQRCYGDSSRTRLVIRNLDPTNSIEIESIRWGTPDGFIVEELLDVPVSLNPFASTSLLTTSHTISLPPFSFDGGRPFFIIEWTSYEKVVPPKIGTIIVAIDPSMGITGMKGGSPTVVAEKARAEKVSKK